MTYIVIIGIIVLASVVMAGGFRRYNIHLDLNHTDTPPVDTSLPGQAMSNTTSTFASQLATYSAGLNGKAK